MKIKTVIIFFMVLGFPVLLYAETAKVITKMNSVREDCKFFSPVRTKVKLNDILEIISIENDWLRVKFGGVKGCIHKSAIEEKKFDLSGLTGTQSKGASSDEVALAGKGFNPEVEKAFKGKHPELDFHKVDEIEGYKITEENIRKFIKNGELKQP